jgi:Uma2 family endonuclease
MTTITLVAKPVSQIQLDPGSVITITNVTWQEFEKILEELGEHRSSRVAYSNETLQIMLPLPEHELPTDLISDIVKTLLKATGRRYQPFRSTTFKQQGAAGVEPDACFYIENYQRMIGRRRLQAYNPPPDLAIETDVASKTTLDAYEIIGVPELWVYDSGRFTIYLLRDEKYVKSDTSPNFPEMALAKLSTGIAQIIPTIVERSWQVGNLQALEELEATLK